MFIETESTPNPQTLKFLPGREVMGARVLDLADAGAAAVSPLGEALFAVDGVERVFLGGDFIAVTKSTGEWQHLKPAIMGAIMDHFTRGLPLVREGAGEAAAGAPAEDDEVVAQIKELIETRVRPAVAQDGGDIIYQGFDEGSGVVYLHLRGACAGCPSSQMTLKHGIENMLRHYIPEVNAVEAV